jgi:predicted MFS family arabinose efflux permease
VSPDRPQVLRLREFRLLLFAQGASVFGDRMVAVALAFAVLEVGGSASSVGLVLATGTFSMVACLLVGGVVADRMSRRALMVTADLVRLGSQGTSAALLIAGSAHVWTLALLAGITGAATGFFNPASTGLLPSVVPPERLQEANGLRATAMSIGEIGGPIVAGVVVAWQGAGWALAVDAGTFVVSALFLSRLRLPRRVPPVQGASFLRDLREGWGAFRSRRWLWTIVVSAGIFNMLWGSWASLGPVVADRDLGGAAAWGTVLGALGVGALIGSVLATRAQVRRPAVVFAISGAAFSVPLAMLAVPAPVPVLAAATLATGAGMMIGNSVWESALQRHVPDQWLSRVTSYDWLASMALTPVGMALAAPLADGIGLTACLWGAAALMLAVTLAPLAVADVRHLPAFPETPEAVR